MDINDIFIELKEKFFSIIENIKDFYKENRKNALIISTMVGIIIICLILLIVISVSKKEDKTIQNPLETNLVLSEKLALPQSPELPRNYNITRQTKDKWDDSEAEEWFTIPSKTEIDSLSISNSNLVEEILEVAP